MPVCWLSACPPRRSSPPRTPGSSEWSTAAWSSGTHSCAPRSSTARPCPTGAARTGRSRRDLPVPRAGRRGRGISQARRWARTRRRPTRWRRRPSTHDGEAATPRQPRRSSGPRGSAPTRSSASSGSPRLPTPPGAPDATRRRQISFGRRSPVPRTAASGPRRFGFTARSSTSRVTAMEPRRPSSRPSPCSRTPTRRQRSRQPPMR